MKANNYLIATIVALFLICIVETLTLIHYYNRTKYLEDVNDAKRELIWAYALYSEGAEELLDSCSIYLDWVDRWDIDDYYIGRHRVDSIWSENY